MSEIEEEKSEKTDDEKQETNDVRQYSPVVNYDLFTFPRTICGNLIVSHASYMVREQESPIVPYFGPSGLDAA